MTTELELERSLIDVMISVAAEFDVLEPAVLAASAEPSVEPRDGGERRLDVIAGIDADLAAVSIMDEVIADVVTFTEPTVISTR